MAVTDLAMTVGDPLRSIALSRLPDPQITLAAVGVMKAVAVCLESPVIMILQASHRAGRQAASYRALRYFTAVLATALTLLFMLLCTDDVYEWLFRTVLASQEVASVARSAAHCSCRGLRSSPGAGLFKATSFITIEKGPSPEPVGFDSFWWVASGLRRLGRLEQGAARQYFLLGGIVVEAVAVTGHTRRA
ncbi:MAG: hypothetical protein R3C68_07425 [Myxococcota bacterium]